MRNEKRSLLQNISTTGDSAEQFLTDRQREGKNVMPYVQHDPFEDRQVIRRIPRRGFLALAVGLVVLVPDVNSPVRKK